ncbi:hypothetical protein OEB99_16470 [Actinotalea sp. M2MS4P-6]|uniref:hypothetical protein n=1 Tax=Actinotalea sp. M2MS4P-6 TaxID=2983762 RepID=UPI0021E50CC0|nr:hypothetical protein [Actinotalea sp. M2MS4P-6]MCV2395911.1 hypothetical protein [Actinotalea sp. M2MS4P-6]
MTPPVDITIVTSWPQAVVATVIVFALLVWPGIAAWLTSRRTNRVLTTNNGGSHVKDQLDRIEADTKDNSVAIATLAGRFDEHLAAEKSRRRR